MTIPGNWRTRHQRYSLRAEHCEICGNMIFPPRDTCPYCAQQRQAWDNLGGGEFGPYTMELVRLAEGPLAMAR
jgi:hypothetical protein